MFGRSAAVQGLRRLVGGDNPGMRKSVRRLAAVIGVALAPLATVALANPAVSSAQPLLCDNGWWWELVANVCRRPLIPPSA